MITLHFTKPGLQTLVVDQGRTGYQAWGIPVGGAVDLASASLANWLVGNSLSAPVLEITLMGPTIEIEGNGQMALTGADLSPQIDGQNIQMYETLDFNSGQRLSFGQAKCGCRCYLAIGGSWQIEPWLGSCSALAYDSSGVTDDSVIKKNSIVTIKAVSNIDSRRIPLNQRPRFPKPLIARILPGPEFDLFSKDFQHQFVNRSFHLSPHSNRMGCRLFPELANHQIGPEMISSGIVPGTIQITSSGQPIVLLVDAQTIGGYHRFANVITADLDAVGQLKPGDEVKFVEVDLVEAYRALNKSHEIFDFLDY